MSTEYYVVSTSQFNELPKKENDVIKYKCQNCGVDSQFLYKKSRHERQSLLLCKMCSMKHTNMERYGVEVSTKNPDVRKKISDSAERIDCASEITVSSTDEFDKVTKKTKIRINYKCLNCGKDSSFLYLPYKAAEQRKLLCTTCLRKSEKPSIAVSSTEEFDALPKREGTKISFICKACGKESSLSYKPVRSSTQRMLICSTCQRKQTTKERFGSEIFFNTKDYRNKSRETSLRKYGTEFPIQSKQVQDKVRESNLKKFGVPYSMQSDSVLNKSRQTYLDKYGKEHPNFNHIYLYDDIYFDSKWELIFYIYHKDMGHNIEREPVGFEYEYKGKTCIYNPDFKVDDIFYEIKGDHFFNPDGTMRNPFDRSQDEKFEAKHQCGIRNGVIFYREKDIEPFRQYVMSKYTNDYTALFQIDLPFPYINDPMIDTSDTGIIRYFHKSIYEASYKGCPSPVDAWKDKNLVKQIAANRLKYVGSCKPKDILRGFSVTRLAPKVSLFKHTLASRLINEYLKDCSTIFDPFSGFSGRLLGAYNCNKTYIGQDINPDHVRESNEIICYKQMDQTKYSVTLQDIITDQSKSYDSLFTCPPYGGKEHWNEHNDEIEKTCDEWIDLCLSKYDCKKYLFVVDKTEKYKDNIVQTLTNKSHFGSNNEYVILITR